MKINKVCGDKINCSPPNHQDQINDTPTVVSLSLSLNSDSDSDGGFQIHKSSDGSFLFTTTTTTTTTTSMATPTSVTTQSSTTISERRRDVHPERPGKPVCPIYKRHGRCNFGSSCILDHPKDLQPMEPEKRKRGEKKPKLLNLCAFTPEQRQAHFERIKETEGFHVGYVPLGSRLVGGMIRPLPLSQCGSGEKNLAKLAIKGYNEEYGTTFKFVKLIRVNFSPVGGVLNFITFQAKDGKPGSRPQNFQTRVYQCIEKTEVQFCRLEQKNSTLPEGPGETSQQPGQ